MPPEEDAIHLDELDLSKLEAEHRRDILTRYTREGKARCIHCDRAFDNYKFLTVDHVKPLSAKGSEGFSNTWPACLHCNHSKGNEPWREWYRQQIFYCPEREALIAEWVLD